MHSGTFTVDYADFCLNIKLLKPPKSIDVFPKPIAPTGVTIFQYFSFLQKLGSKGFEALNKASHWMIEMYHPFYKWESKCIDDLLKVPCKGENNASETHVAQNQTLFLSHYNVRSCPTRIRWRSLKNQSSNITLLWLCFSKRAGIIFARTWMCVLLPEKCHRVAWASLTGCTFPTSVASTRQCEIVTDEVTHFTCKTEVAICLLI